MQAEEVVRRARRQPLLAFGTHTRALHLGRSAIERILPHREPFVFVDTIVAVDLEQNGVWAQRRIVPDDPVFAGHFPGHPVYPGVLQLEALGQAGLCALYFCRNATVDVLVDRPPMNARALKVHQALFMAEVGPGDELTLLAKVLEQDAFTATLAGQVLRDQEVCAVAAMEAYVVGD